MINLIPIYLEDPVEINNFKCWFIKFKGIQTKSDILDVLRYTKIKGSVEIDPDTNVFTIAVTEGSEGCIKALTSLVDFFRAVNLGSKIIDARNSCDMKITKDQIDELAEPEVATE